MVVVNGDELLVLWLHELIGCFSYAVNCSVVDGVCFGCIREVSRRLFLYFAVFLHRVVGDGLG